MQKLFLIVLTFFTFGSCLCLASPIENREIGGLMAPIFSKHRATTTSGAVVEESRFDDARVCSACHTDIYQEWRSSMMSHAWDDPIYRALLSRASRETGGELDHFCTGCHTPVGLLTGQVTTEDNQQPPDIHEADTDLPGVDCEACHTMSGISGVHNGAYIIDADSEERIKFGPRNDAESPYHGTAHSALHSESEICATCHNVTHPLNGVPVERTYDEWYESPYRDAGISCQDCHMQSRKGRAAIMGPIRDDRADHSFAGANTTILEHFGHKRNAEKARRLLRASAELELVRAPVKVVPGELVDIAIKVSNVGAGHKLPTGFPEGREVWLDFKILDAEGETVYRLGAIKNGKTEPGTRNFMVHMGDKDGNKVEVEVWRVTHVMYDNRILPKGHAVVDYRFIVPEDVKGPLTLKADLNYWPFSQALVDELLGEGKLEVIVENIISLEAGLPVAKSDVAGGL